MQSIESLNTYVYGMNEDFVGNEEDIKCNNIIKQ